MTEIKKSKGLHIALWIAQGLLAAAFGMAGLMKVSLPMEELIAKGMGFVNHTPEGTVRLIGMVEILGALGLLLPSALRLLPILTPLAALGLAIVMVLATQDHLANNESAVPTIVLFLLSVFVAWGRMKKAPIQAK